MTQFTLPLLLSTLLVARGGMVLEDLFVDGTTQLEGLRGDTAPGNINNVEGANKFWCNMWFNKLKDSTRGAANELSAEEESRLQQIAVESGLDASTAAIFDGDHRAEITPGAGLKITGTTTAALMGNFGGQLSFAYNPGQADFYRQKSPGHPDGGFQLGAQQSYAVAPWPEGGATGTAFSYTFEWPLDTFNGTYTVQVLFRGKYDTDMNETFAQCVDLRNVGGKPLPVGCDPSDPSSCPGLIPNAVTRPPIVEPDEEGVVPPAPEEALSGGYIAAIIICSLLIVAIICIIVWCCCFKQEPPPKQPEPEEEPIKHKAPEPVQKEPSSEDKDSDSNIVQIQYTDPVPVEMEAPAPESGEQSGETGTPVSEPPSDGSQGRVFHFRYIANEPGADDGSEQQSEGGTMPGL